MARTYLMDKKVVKRMKDHCTLEFLTGKYPKHSWEEIEEPMPSQEDLQEWTSDGGCEAVACGCWVEPDGHCRHGNPSWLIALGWI